MGIHIYMKCLLFNHHPDYFFHLWKAFTALDIEVHCATEALTIKCGAPYSSTKKDNVFQLSDALFKHTDLFPELANLKFSDSLDGYDFYYTHMRPLAEKIQCKNLFFGATVEWDLDFNRKDVTKVTSLKNRFKELNAQYLQYYVPESELVVDKHYLTVIAANWGNISFIKDLINLRNNSDIPVIISGNNDAPDKFVRDVTILPQTALLAHEKYYGTNCNSVCKALDKGIPVYTTKSSYERLGFSDLPEDLFYFKDDISLLDAYKDAVNSPRSSYIQRMYRHMRPFSTTVECAENLLNYLQ